MKTKIKPFKVIFYGDGYLYSKVVYAANKLKAISKVAEDFSEVTTVKVLELKK